MLDASASQTSYVAPRNAGHISKGKDIPTCIFPKIQFPVFDSLAAGSEWNFAYATTAWHVHNFIVRLGRLNLSNYQSIHGIYLILGCPKWLTTAIYRAPASLTPGPPAPNEFGVHWIESCCLELGYSPLVITFSSAEVVEVVSSDSTSDSVSTSDMSDMSKSSSQAMMTMITGVETLINQQGQDTAQQTHDVLTTSWRRPTRTSWRRLICTNFRLKRRLLTTSWKDVF